MTQTAPSGGAPSQTRLMIIGTLLYICGGGPTYVMPAYLDAAGQVLKLNDGQLGLLSGAESLGIGLACVLTGLLVRRVNWIVVVVAAALCVLGDVLMTLCPDFQTLTLVRFATGFGGEGPLYAISYIVLAQAIRPHRAFGVALTGVALVAAATLHFQTQLGAVFSDAGPLAPCAAAAILAALMVAQSRSIGLKSREAADETAPTAAIRYDAVAILLSLAIWSAAAGAFWAFSETAAGAVHVAPATIAEALSIGIIAGLAGAAAPIVLGERLGQVPPLALATAGLIIASLLFFASSDLLRLAVAVSLVQFCWNIATVYQLAGLAGVDPDGRYSALGAVAQLAGLALGPAVAGLLIGPMGYNAVTLVLIVCAGIGLALFWFARRLGPAAARA